MGCQSLRGTKTSSMRIMLLVWHSSIHCIQEVRNGHSSAVPPGILCQWVGLNIILYGLPHHFLETCMVLQRVKPTNFHKPLTFPVTPLCQSWCPEDEVQWLWRLETFHLVPITSQRFYISRDTSQHLLDGIHGFQIVYANDCRSTSKIKENSIWEKLEKSL